MRQIRPSIDELKLRYSRDLAQRKMLERRRAARPEGERKVKTPDNSEPWLPHPPRSVAECAWVSQQVAASIEEWKRQFPKVFSSAV